MSSGTFLGLKICSNFDIVMKKNIVNLEENSAISFYVTAARRYFRHFHNGVSTLCRSVSTNYLLS